MGRRIPHELVMTEEENASLSGLDQGELITIPALPDVVDLEKFEAVR